MTSDLAAIRERDAAFGELDSAHDSLADRRALLAHIDALTAKVEGLPDETDYYGCEIEGHLSRTAVLAILRGEA